MCSPWVSRSRLLQVGDLYQRAPSRHRRASSTATSSTVAEDSAAPALASPAAAREPSRIPRSSERICTCPVMIFESETDVLVLGVPRGPTATDPVDKKEWEVAGTAHYDTYGLVEAMTDTGSSAAGSEDVRHDERVRSKRRRPGRSSDVSPP